MRDLICKHCKNQKSEDTNEYDLLEAEDYDCTFAKSCTAQIDFAYNIATKLDGPKKVLSNQLAIAPEPPEVLAKGFFLDLSTTPSEPSEPALRVIHLLSRTNFGATSQTTS